MNKKQHLFRLTDEHYELVKAYIKRLQTGESDTPEPKSQQKQERASDVQQFLDTAEKWYGAMKQLVEIGTIKQIPQIFTNCAPIQQVSPTGIVSGGTVELPQFVEDVLNGGSYPNPEDCTEEERGVLYNTMFQEHYKRYISTKDDKSRGLLRGIIAEFIEHNFPMLEKDRK